VTFILYHTLGCHLCELAETVIAKANLTLHEHSLISVEKVDIAENLDLTEKYGVKIPVLSSASGQELNWPFDADDVINLVSVSEKNRD